MMDDQGWDPNVPPHEDDGRSGDDAAPFDLTPFELDDPRSIPPRQWLFGRHLIRGFLSLTVSPGGVGKSSLLIDDALAMATGRALLGIAPPKLLRVAIWNGEDPRDELRRRIGATCLHFGITRADIGDRLLVDSGRDLPITLATAGPQGVKVATPMANRLIEAIKARQIDCLVVDPFVTTHMVPENETTAMNAVVAEWRRIADATECAIELVHHTSKAGAMNGDEMGIYASRGAGALIDGVRSARYLTRMRQDEADRFGIQDPEQYFRVTMGKANLAPFEKATWRRMIGVPLGNGSGFWPEGDNIGVCIAWTPPDAFEGLTCRDLRRVQDAIAACEEPPKENERAADWAGYVVAEAMGLDTGQTLKKQERTPAQTIARAKVRQLLSSWIKSGALVVETQRSPRDGRDVKVILVGEAVTSEDMAGVAP